MRVRAIVVLLIAAAPMTSGGCTSKPPEDYPAKIAARRAQTDAFLGASPDIILPKDREKFLPLSYFPPDESYSVPAQLKPSEERVRITTPTSTGKIRDMELVGVLQFTLQGQPLQLSALVDAGTEKITRLSVMFTDLTTGTETYDAGRYMELDPTATGIYMVDFNLAFQPYCYYNPAYDCPYPPKENRLSIPIRAGERLRGGDQTGPR